MTYAPRGAQRPIGRLKLDGYRGRRETGRSVNGSWPVGADGFPVPFCTQHTDYAVDIAATAPTTAVQPSVVEIQACFGTRTGAARKAFTMMLHTLSIATSPSQTAPVPGSKRCRRDNLHLSYSEQGSEQTIIGNLTFTNVSSRTCHVKGYPKIILLTAAGKPIHDAQFIHLHRPHELYLRPGASVSTFIQVFNSEIPPRTATAATALIYLHGVHAPFTRHFPRGGLAIYDHRVDIHVAPLEGT